MFFFIISYFFPLLLVEELPLEEDRPDEDLPEEDLPLDELPLETLEPLLVGGLETVPRVVDLVVVGLETLLFPVLLRVGVVYDLLVVVPLLSTDVLLLAVLDLSVRLTDFLVVSIFLRLGVVSLIEDTELLLLTVL